MAWQTIVGSYAPSASTRGDVILAGGSDFHSLAGGPPAIPSNYAGWGRGCQLLPTDGGYSVELDLIQYGLAAENNQWGIQAGTYWDKYPLDGTSANTYVWYIEIAVSTDFPTDGTKANYVNQLKEVLPNTDWHGGDILYANDGWTKTAYHNQVLPGFVLKSEAVDRWVRVKIYGEDADEQYIRESYFKLEDAISLFRPFAIRKSGKFLSLDNNGGFLQIRKTNTWKNIELISYDDVGKEGKGTSQMRKEGKWVAHRRFGYDSDVNKIISVDPFYIGESNNVTGTYDGSRVSHVRLIINDQTPLGAVPVLPDGTFKYYALENIKSVDDTVIVQILDDDNKVLDSKNVEILKK
ncbi:immunoglobulin-like domain-containing protein [Enterococcus sp. DIV0240a]|uniref:immunoglobulin-like domain-containing protein n=1 Tax=Enterococcus sp. DIV0240a TaxID=2774651 RepID=UPI003D27E887